MEAPWQHLRSLIEESTLRARHSVTIPRRSALHGTGEIDFAVLRCALDKLALEDRRWLSIVLTLSKWSDAKASSIDADHGDFCHLCGEPDGSAEHVVWKCKSLAQYRKSDTFDFSSINLDSLDKAIRIGLPPAMSASSGNEFWQSCSGQTMHEQDRILYEGRATLDSYSSAFIDQHLAEGNAQNARQIMGEFRQQQTGFRTELLSRIEHMHELSNIAESPPLEPNVFTDGACKLPPIKHGL